MAVTAPSRRVGHLSWRQQLYRGENRYDIVGRKKIWYLLSAIVLIAGIVSLGVKGFNLSIDFKGGDTFQVAANGHTISDAEKVLSAQGINEPVVQKLGENQILVTTPVLNDSGNGGQVSNLQVALAKEFGVTQNAVSVESVGSSWGSQITDKAIEGLLIFLVVVALYIGIRFEPKMAVAAFVALIHDLIITAGIYSLVGFEVSPSTVIAVLTILGFSLYDTVVVFDRVRENTEGISPRSNRTYTTAANVALNQTLMRSINTSLIALLPVAALLFVGAGLLGAGTLKDLALAQFVGLAAGAYSSIFIATPLLVQLKEREPGMKELQKRVAFLATHKPSALDAAESQAVAAEWSDTPTAADSPASVPLGQDPSAPPIDDDAPARIPGSPMRQQGARRRKNRGRPSGKRR